ncbi:hypothetical protein PF008_g30804 [Phytophthora fragariae]|uniref:Uncharacterized protein n=1 Tax=Phytophthora fragariae TaxID=53985 RepID=A0A6G0Q4G5_9STRA|nr:hypothetical protein PF008_g30804 [Phytophthora fragariae]
MKGFSTDEKALSAAVVRYHLVLRDIKPVYKMKFGKEMRGLSSSCKSICSCKSFSFCVYAASVGGGAAHGQRRHSRGLPVTSTCVASARGLLYHQSSSPPIEIHGPAYTYTNLNNGHFPLHH